MEPINRGVGLTPSERYLAQLADRTFLDLWSYPNTFNDRRSGGKGAGQELCDLLVVCGNDVIIFSDKSIAWPHNDDPHLSWSRWFRKAVTKSVDQIRGAERWLKRYPDRVFIDSMCTKALPIGLPSTDKMRIHGIAIALGAQEACSVYFGDPDGSLMIRGGLRGSEHVDRKSERYTPFAFGDVDPDGAFVHVFDETALNLVLREMNTIADFVWYLNARENVVRNEKIFACSEADMLATYLLTEDEDGSHGFPTGASVGAGPDGIIGIPRGEYERYLRRPERTAKRKADVVSYAWDRLIQEFTKNLLAGTSVAVAGIEPEVARAERAVRAMALECRTVRRGLAEALLGALSEAERHRKDRFARVIVKTSGFADPDCGFAFLVLAYQGLLAEEGYDKYRLIRASLLRAYCEVALYDNRHLKRMLGIAVDASSTVTGREGGSEDLMLVEIAEWTADHEQAVALLKKNADILRPARLRSRSSHFQEFPELLRPAQRLGNRAARRAERSRSRRQR